MEVKQAQIDMRDQKEPSPFQHVSTDDGKIRVELYQRERFIKFNFVNGQNVHLNNSIRFSDMKAGALIAANGTLIKFGNDLIKAKFTLNIWIANIGMLLLMAGILFAILVVMPKRVNHKEKGVHYWEHISNYEKDDFVETLDDMEVSELLQKSMKNNYDQATILKRKFRTLRLAFIVSGSGYFLVGTAILISLFSVLK
jgi:Family of unknown function (DUF5706)